MGRQFTIFDHLNRVNSGVNSRMNSAPPPAADAPSPDAATPEPIYSERSAVLSNDGRFRYRLVRRWSVAPAATFVMLNPSTADADLDDPTIRRCEGFARSWGHGGIVVVNLFAFRATDPRDLVNAMHAGEDVVGPENDTFLRDAVTGSSLTVAAWGTRGRLAGRDTAVVSLIQGLGVALTALRVSKDGLPVHPLYLPANLKPIPYPVTSP